uniref:dCMP deaminase n=1 Tax=Poecilia latipinna TaxID=48699 RepID=A0A3B3TSI0_9TELE
MSAFNKLNILEKRLEELDGATRKRDDYLEWPEYFMAVAFLSAQRSKDPSSQVGACIVNQENKIVGIGYNGMPNGCDDDLLPWSRSADDRLNTKYPYVCHAELNAIMNKNSADVKGCTMYVALFPCNECAKLIIQAGDCWDHTAKIISLLGRLIRAFYCFYFWGCLKSKFHFIVSVDCRTATNDYFNNWLLK